MYASSRSSHMEGATAVVGILSRRMVRPASPSGHHQHQPATEEIIHLTPWDLRLIRVDYVQKGILLSKPPANHNLADALEFSEVSAADIVASLYTLPLVSSFFRLNRVVGTDAALEPRLPVISAQVTELADGVFVGVSMNHTVGDGTTFWDFVNTWSEIHRRRGISDGSELSTQPPGSLQRWFVPTSPVPIPMPFPKLQHVVRRFEPTAVKECFVPFSATSVRKLKARANAEIAADGTAISSLQAVLAPLWRAVCRARRLPPGQRTSYSVLVRCRGRVRDMPATG